MNIPSIPSIPSHHHHGHHQSSSSWSSHVVIIVIINIIIIISVAIGASQAFIILDACNASPLWVPVETDYTPKSADHNFVAREPNCLFYFHASFSADSLWTERVHFDFDTLLLCFAEFDTLFAERNLIGCKHNLHKSVLVL